MPRRSQPTARLNDHVGFRWFRGGGWVGDMYALSWFLAGAGWLVPWPVSMHQSFSGADCFLASSAFKLAYGRVRGAHWNCLAGRVDMTIVRSSDDLARLASCVRRTSEVSDIYDSLAIATELPLLPAPIPAAHHCSQPCSPLDPRESHSSGYTSRATLDSQRAKKERLQAAHRLRLAMLRRLLLPVATLSLYCCCCLVASATTAAPPDPLRVNAPVVPFKLEPLQCES